MNIEQKLLARIPKSYGRYISCREGWYGILKDLDEKLSYLDPDYRIVQIKEKFGTLRFYFDTDTDSPIRGIMYDCVRAAEINSALVCEYCGNGLGANRREFDHTVKLREGGWVKTSCDTCWTKKQEERQKRDQALDELVKFNQENGLYDLELNNE